MSDPAQTPTTSRARRLWLGLGVVSLLAGYLATGLYMVAADEQGVVRRFGAFAERVGPGMHYSIPWPIDRVDVLKTTAVMTRSVGFVMPEQGEDLAVGMELLTSDTNILNIAIVLQYTLSQPADYLFHVETPEALMGNLAEAVLTQAVIAMPVDEVLTTGRLSIQERVKAETQAMLDRHRAGIQIASANIMTITLDPSVAEAFQKVADALADREKKQNEARAYANNTIPKARGEAHKLVLEAEGYRDQRVAEAIGTNDRFLALLAEYEKAPKVTRSRLYLQAMEKILPRLDKYIIDSEGGEVPFNLRVTKP